MSAQKLDRTMMCYRIGDPDGEYPIYDATGSRLYPGRWNTENTPGIYTSEHYSTAMLEKLVHGNGHLPPNQHFIEITLPVGLSFEMVTKDHLPGWDSKEPSVSRKYGQNWILEKRSVILIVPSYVARLESNVVLNPEHSEFHQITIDLATPVWWDARLFG